jgi:hypothetical protein
LLVTVTKDCISAASVLSLPGKVRSVSLHSGYGSSALSVSLSNGMITAVGQTVDSKIPETITAVSGLATAAKSLLVAPGGGTTTVCTPVAAIYPIVNGVPDQSKPLVIKADVKVVKADP